MFAYGLSYPIFAQFLSSLHISDDKIGLFMTLTLLGDAFISFVLTAITDQVGRRKVLSAGAILMILSGVVFTFSSSYWTLVLAAVVGVISPSGKEIGPFKAVEESVLAQLTDRESRSDIFAWYSLLGTGGLAVGTLLCGWMVQLLQNNEALSAWAYRSVFVLYAVTGVGKLLLILALTPAIELEPEKHDYLELSQDNRVEGEDENNGNTAAPFLQTNQRENTKKQPPTLVSNLLKGIRDLFPYITHESRSILFRLLLLFGVDSFASGVASPSWLTYFFTTVHSLDYGPLGTLFLVTNGIAAISALVALPIARRLGPLKTMVFTHLPSALFLAMVPWPPATTTGTWLAMAFLALRSSTSSMDQAPRQAFLTAAVLPSERTAVLGVVNTMKTLAQAGGTGVAGLLVNRGWWIPTFTGAGVMKVIYDLSLLWLFVGVTSREAAAATI